MSFQTVYTVLWYLHKLSIDPQLQNRMRKSIAESPADYETPLVRACLRETLRLYPIATFTGRILDSDATVDGYNIPKGWLALMSFYTSGRDPTNFSDPLTFAPDRWRRSENQTAHDVINPHATLPFAKGVRSCVGKKTATYEIHFLITKVKDSLRMDKKFRWTHKSNSFRSSNSSRSSRLTSMKLISNRSWLECPTKRF